jgi:hypothetical protein
MNYDILIYNTIKKAIKKALGLYVYPLKGSNKQYGTLTHKVYLICNPMDLFDIQPVIDGELARLAGTNQLAGRLPIDAVIPYAGGLNDGLVWGKETLKFPGVEQGTFYVVVTNDTYSGYSIIKRAPSMEMGDGDVLALTTEKRAWSRIRAIYADWVLPKTESGKAYGGVVKGNLPTA